MMLRAKDGSLGTYDVSQSWSVFTHTSIVMKVPTIKMEGNKTTTNNDSRKRQVSVVLPFKGLHFTAESAIIPRDES